MPLLRTAGSRLAVLVVVVLLLELALCLAGLPGYAIVFGLLGLAAILAVAATASYGRPGTSGDPPVGR